MLLSSVAVTKPQPLRAQRRPISFVIVGNARSRRRPNRGNDRGKIVGRILLLLPLTVKEHGVPGARPNKYRNTVVEMRTARGTYFSGARGRTRYERRINSRTRGLATSRIFAKNSLDHSPSRSQQEHDRPLVNERSVSE